METVYFTGSFLPKEEVKISPDDRGFVFADGVYEVVKWYEGSFYDMDGHVTRLKRSLSELRIHWKGADSFPAVATDLIKINKLEKHHAMVYLQVTRGVAKRKHSFPSPEVSPTVYANVWNALPENTLNERGIKVMLKEDIRWNRCDIKSVSLLANVMSFQEASENGYEECIFVRDGLITEGSHSNIFFVKDDTLITHPISNHILAGITRKNVLRIAGESGIKIREEALKENMLNDISEAFITNTSSGVVPVSEIGGHALNNKVPGSVTEMIHQKFMKETSALKG